VFFVNEGHRKPEGNKREIVQKAQVLCIICCSLDGRLNCNNAFESRDEYA